METISNLERVKEFHDQDASSYRQDRYHAETCEGLAYLTRKELVTGLVDLEQGRVLDLGCGPGILTRDLVARGLEVYSTDISLGMIREARATLDGMAESGRASFAIADAAHICYANGSMNQVLCIGVVIYLEDYVRLLDEIRRVLHDDGKLVIQIDYVIFPQIYRALVPLYQALKSKLTGKSYDELNFNFNYFNYRQFFRALEVKGFCIEGLEYYDFRIPFIDVLLPKLSVRLGRFMFKHRDKRIFRPFSYGLLIKAGKVAASSDY